MALNNGLVANWNFDTVTGSDGSGSFIVNDETTGYSAKSYGFTPSSTEFILKEELITNKKQHFENLQGIDTIEVLSSDDVGVSDVKKPSSIKLAVENSMYQVVSDEMMNLFSTVNAYAFKFTVPNNKYLPEYKKLIETRNSFFENVTEKPNFEKYIEFYKWIDTSLGTLVDQLLPENSSDIGSLKTTVESHILERNKYGHILPLRVQPNNVYSSGITIIKTDTLANSSKEKSLSSDAISLADESINGKNVNIENVQGYNFQNNYEVFNTAGKTANKHVVAGNRSVIKTNFSAGDGLSETYRDSDTGEFSVYNDLNQRARTARDLFNVSEAAQTDKNSGSLNNNFIQYNIPRSTGQYTDNGETLEYTPIPTERTETLRNNNYLIKDEENNKTIIEPPIEYNIPVKHKIRVAGAFEDVEIYSPYYNKIDTFSPRTVQNTDGVDYFDPPDINKKDDRNTFFRKTENLSKEEVTIKSIEILDNIYPRKDLVGLYITKDKDSYTESLLGNLTENSYNQNSAIIRTFWRDTANDRRRLIYAAGNGPYNCLDRENDNTYSSPVYLHNSYTGLVPDANLTVGAAGSSKLRVSNRIQLNYNIISSLYALENNYTRTLDEYSGINSYGRAIKGITDHYTTNNMGDLAPYNDNDLARFILVGQTVPNAKPQFIHSEFKSYEFDSLSAGPYGEFYLYKNDSYKSGVDSTIKPWYDGYSKYFENIKHLSFDKSVIPEFLYSDYYVENDSSYLRLLGRGTYDSLDETKEYFISDFNKFINKKSNKIKINFNAVKKLLPYNGFYPAQASLMAAKKFKDAYLQDYYNLGGYTPAVFDDYNIQAGIQPFFGPGILYNTIKAGLAMPYYIGIKPSAPTAITDLYAILPPDLPETVDNTRSEALASVTANKIPFEAILSPEIHLFNSIFSANNLCYLDPSRYTKYFTFGSSLKFPSVEIADIILAISRNPQEIKIYKNFINNFLAEIPNFFLKQQKLTSFISKPENQFIALKPSTTYEFSIEIKQSNAFSMFYKTNSNILDYPSFFSVRTQNGYINAPPHITGENYKIKLSFTTSATAENKKYSLAEIFSNLVITSNGSSAYVSLVDSLNIKQSVAHKDIIYDSATGNPSTTSLDTNNNVWVIQTKFETPLINYTTLAEDIVSPDINSTYSRFDNTDTTELQVKNLLVKPTAIDIEGIWSRLGEVPSEGSSIQIRLSDEDAVNSLLQAVGFQAEEKSIGVLADNKKISEAIVLLPFQETPSEYTYPEKNIIENKHLFKIDPKTINRLLQVSDYKSLKIEQIKNILDTNKNIDKTNSIVDLMVKMVNYNIPPHLNWLYDPAIDPFVMYIGEFTHTLSKQDLANIWQGTMPEIATTPEEQTVTLEHYIGRDQLFGDIDFTGDLFTKFPTKVKVFKAKYRANNNYYKLTADISDDQNYSFGTNDSSIPWYTYNWPYDYFSLVELVNIQSGEVEDGIQTQIEGELKAAVNDFVQNTNLNLQTGGFNLTSAQNIGNFFNSIGSFGSNTSGSV
jgi:hypothetical protein